MKTNAGKAYRVKRFVPHEGYNPVTSDNDIALVEIDGEVSNSVFLNINKDENKPSVKTEVTVIGWGRLSEGGVSSNTLQKVTIPTVGYRTCRQSYPNLTENMLCAGEDQGGKDSCQGDSGGPLLHKEGSSWVQVGVVSFGRGCARPNLYGVYTRVSNYAGWIEQKMN